MTSLAELPASTSASAAVTPVGESPLHHLTVLARCLGRQGWYARITTPPKGISSVHVISPESLTLETRILAVPDGGGTFWYLSGEVQQLGTVHHVDEAIDRIKRILIHRRM